MKSPESADANRSWPWFASALILFAIVVGFASLLLDDTEPTPEPTTTPSTLRIGVLPDQDPETLQRRFAPVLEYLSAELQIPCELKIPNSYGQLVEMFHHKEVELAYFGGYSFIKAQQNDQARSLVMRRIDTRFTSYLLVHADSEARNIEDLRGKRLAFGSTLSTSGHLMPRHFLQKMNLEPEVYFSSVEYSGAHDKTVYWVRDGRADVGATNANTVRTMLQKGLVNANEVRVLWETPPYADYVWAIAPTLNDELASKISNAFLQLTPENADHRKILHELNATGYIPADPEYFSDLAEIVRRFEEADGTGQLN